ncbi:MULTISPECIES: DUF3078 domain-containing protein [Tenacibaculum]|uniref:DUF3078 domain-containing protein n=1 Tax=Tenacibaculum TaxID=104267 RepID=UPI001F0B1362|nr:MULTISPECIES: DUF3078 domain-containing protein [Tenacibaculum]MCH3881279.1 DUF3078 domain-containing protein [Tenacibaculum aquimarinum]MDO6599127.1 DUF3078 domain-containing protein [Tenacibaculum sp. 1_MG-2023]
MKKLILIVAFAITGVSLNAQTVEELKKELSTKQGEIGKLQGEANALQSQIDAFPGWKYGAFGTFGANISGFNNWYSKGTPNTSAGNIGIIGNGFANLDREKFFWRNSLNVNLSWIKNDNTDDPADSDSFDGTNDVFTVSSLYGYKLTDKLAVSALGEYRTTLISNFNDPGYLDLGVGITWTPIQNLVVVVHPLNYNFVFADNDAAFESSMGAKIFADYTRKLGPVNFKSNLSAFQSYKSGDLSNVTWINSFGYTFWKGIGLGFEFGLRDNKQEALNNALLTTPSATFGNVNSKLQSYWLFGLNFSM